MSEHDPGLRCDIRVSDELRDLARAAGRRSTAPSLSQKAHRAASAPRQGAGSMPQCLRRDGKRPLKFRGRRLLRFEQKARDAGQARIDVFLSDDQEMIVQTAAIPAEGLPVRPCFRVRVATDAAEFARAVSEDELALRPVTDCMLRGASATQLQAFSTLCAAVSRTATTYSKQQH